MDDKYLKIAEQSRLEIIPNHIRLEMIFSCANELVIQRWNTHS